MPDTPVPKSDSFLAEQGRPHTDLFSVEHGGHVVCHYLDHLPFDMMEKGLKSLVHGSVFQEADVYPCFSCSAALYPKVFHVCSPYHK